MGSHLDACRLCKENTPGGFPGSQEGESGAAGFMLVWMFFGGEPVMVKDGPTSHPLYPS